MLFVVARGSFVVSGSLLGQEFVVVVMCRGELYTPGDGTVLELTAVELDMEIMEYPLSDGSAERRKDFL